MNEEKVESGSPAPATSGESRGEKGAHRNMVILLLVGIAALGVMLWRVDQELTFLTRTLADISEDVRSSEPSKPQAPAPKETVVAQLTMKTKSGLVTVTQTCKGMVDARTDTSLPFCVSENRLVASVSGGEPVEITSKDAETAASAPVLSKLEYIAGSNNVLISYGPDACVTAGECGAGMPYHQVSFALDATTSAFRRLVGFPGTGSFIWSPDGVKALIVPDTCGGGGCGVAPLSVYDLAKDAVKAATEDQAAGMRDFVNGAAVPALTDAEGRQMPAWVSATWAADSASFNAEIRPENQRAALKKVEGKYE